MRGTRVNEGNQHRVNGEGTTGGTHQAWGRKQGWRGEADHGTVTHSKFLFGFNRTSLLPP